MINDMTECGKVTADGITIYEKGCFKDELLK